MEPIARWGLRLAEQYVGSQQYINVNIVFQWFRMSGLIQLLLAFALLNMLLLWYLCEHARY
jgi:hypothetical protein